MAQQSPPFYNSSALAQHWLDLENLIVTQDLEHIVANFGSWSFFDSKAILITGGGGLIASYLVRTFLFANDFLGLDLCVTCLLRTRPSNLSRLGPWLNHPSLQLVYGVAESFDYSLLGMQNIVIHAASNASPSLYSKDPIGTLLPNVTGTLSLCRQASIWCSERFLFFSSSEVYGDTPKKRISEEDFGSLNPCLVRSCYAESKRMGETICKSYSSQHSLHTISARIFHTYGPQLSQEDGRVFADFVSDAVNGKDLLISSDGLAKRCFCYITDAITAFLVLLSKGVAGESYNVANPEAESSITDLALLISDLSPSRPQIRYVDQAIVNPEYLPSKISSCSPTVDKLSLLGWSPLVSLRDGFDRTIKSHSAHSS